MDGLFHVKPYEQMDDLGGFPPMFGSTPIYTSYTSTVYTVYHDLDKWHNPPSRQIFRSVLGVDVPAPNSLVTRHESCSSL